MSPVSEICRQLRINPTPEETILLDALKRRNTVGEQFLRHFALYAPQPSGEKTFYIADLYCPNYKLVIEIDGPLRQLKKGYDENRDMVLNYCGLYLLRFTNIDIANTLNYVIAKIEDHIAHYNSV